MNWKTEAVEKLKRYQAMKSALNQLPLEIARAQAQACAIRGSRLDAPAVKDESRREQAALDNLVLRQELDWALEDAQYWVKTTEGALKTLNDEEKQILYRMYIRPEPGAVATLCRELDAEQSSIYRWRENALRKFTLALYGALEH